MTGILAVEAWHREVVAQAARGRTWLDVLAAVDRGAAVELVLRLGSPDEIDSIVLVTRLEGEAPRVESLTDVLPAAGWHEREIAEMFGVHFVGHPDPRPLLLRDPTGPPPLRKSTPLPARLDTAWPGSTGVTERRRSRASSPPGVRPEWVERPLP